MIINNWMNPDPTTITSDTLVMEANRILTQKNLRALPVVDNGRLRGVISRANCLRATENVARTQDGYEFDYLAKRLKVKDLMVRNPVTMRADDTMELALRTGQMNDISQFPVLDNDEVVGIVSAAEVFRLAANILGAWEHWDGITLAPMPIEVDTLSRIAGVLEAAGMVLQSIFTAPVSGQSGKKVIVRFQSADSSQAVEALKKAGYLPIEVRSDVQNCCDQKQKKS